MCPSSAAASQLPLEGLSSSVFATSVLYGLYTVVKSWWCLLRKVQSVYLQDGWPPYHMERAEADPEAAELGAKP